MSTDRLLQEASAERHRSLSGSNPTMFFIVGRGRSGTTLLRRILNAHPNLAVPPEAMFIMNLYRKYRRVTEWDREKLLSFFDDLWVEKRLSYWHLNAVELEQQLLEHEGYGQFADLCKEVYANYAQVQGKFDVVALGDKNPHYCLFLPQLIDLFPDAKFIHVVRDFRDNILSYQNVSFDTSNTSALAYRWKRYNAEILKSSEKYFEQFILLRYEDLLTKPRISLERVCHFLGIGFHPGMLEYYRDQGDGLAAEWHINLQKPLDEARVFAWKRRMQTQDVRKADFVCRDIAAFYGYENTSAQTSFSLFASTLPGILQGWLMTSLERLVILLPTRLMAAIINSYRALTGSLRHA